MLKGEERVPCSALTTARPRCAFGSKLTKYKTTCLRTCTSTKPRFCRGGRCCGAACNAGRPASLGPHLRCQGQVNRMVGNCFSLFNRPGQRYSKMSRFKISLISKLKMVPRVPNPGISKLLAHAVGDSQHFRTGDGFCSQ